MGIANVGLNHGEPRYWIDPRGTKLLDCPMGNQDIGLTHVEPYYWIGPLGTKILH